MKRIRDIIEEIVSEKGNAVILDVGGLLQYWMMLEKNLAEKCHLIILSDEPQESTFSDLADQFPGSVEFRHGDACDLSEYKDDEFDLVHSNSVVEHVGNYERKVQFSKETQRVGRYYYVQTPNLWFPVDPHYMLPIVHWLPAPYRFKRLTYKGLGPGNPPMHDYAKAAVYIEHTDLLDWEFFKHLFPDCEKHVEKVGPFKKSFIGIRKK
ncbi:class I SAM-dependent methyltransferase [uncultured Cohaesibacter sp.]|uniref:class I SAM-dependent methyltransferase n=1 Tax=uncultured Cohaesibacter sp. TaxID=1002546 RepID=UPI002930AF06|nr:class I SAM-dependent methyltransferase [uncultured Cohaesibacter sp.]